MHWRPEQAALWEHTGAKFEPKMRVQTTVQVGWSIGQRALRASEGESETWKTAIESLAAQLSLAQSVQQSGGS